MSDDEALIRRASEGDRAAFDRLYAGHRAAVVTRLTYLCGPGVAIDDLVQDTFIRAHRSMRGFRGECPFLWWLLRIATHVARSHQRSFRRSLWRLFTSSDEESALDERTATTPQPELRAVHHALERISRRLREAVILHDLEGRTLAEIAGELELPLPTVAARVRRGRAELRALLEKNDARGLSAYEVP